MHRWFDSGYLRCTYCGAGVYCTCGSAELEPGAIFHTRITDLLNRQATLDHVIPRSRGGKHIADNVAVACRSCNSSKKDLIFPSEWIPKRDLFTYIAGSDKFSLPANASRMEHAIMQLCLTLNTEEPPPSVAEVCADRHWRPRDVHQALSEMHHAKGFCVFAHPCAPASRYYHPITDPEDGFAGAVWVDGWS
nr:HNH endonuclease [Actinomadura algeriensis]